MYKKEKISMKLKELKIAENQNIMIFLNNAFKYNGIYNNEIKNEYGEKIISKISASNNSLIINIG